MEFIKRALSELKYFLLVFDFVSIFINSLLFFFIGFFLSVLLRFSWLYSFLFFLVAFFAYAYLTFSENRLSYVESKVPGLREILRTASDNVEKDNFVVNLLKADVLERLKGLPTSAFVDMRNLWMKTLSIILFSFGILILSFFHVSFDYQVLLPDVGEDIGEPLGDLEKVYDLSLAYDTGNLSDILGNKSLAALGDEELFLEVDPLASELDISQVEDVGPGDFGDIPQFPKEIYTSYGSSFSDEIPKENQEIVKNYFKDLSQG